MLAVQLDRFAASAADFADVLIVSPPPAQPLAPTAVRVRITLSPVNPSDVLSVLGVYAAFQPSSFPAVPGFEGVGIVEAVGRDVPATAGLRAGQRVVPQLEAAGAWQTHVDVPYTHVFAVPDGVSDEAAAQAFINPVTVAGITRELNLPRGSWLVQTAAASAFARQLAAYAHARLGVRTVNLIRRNDPAQIAEITKNKDDVVVVTAGLTPAQITARILEATGGERPAAAVDAVGGELTGALAAAVADRGRVLVYGVLGGASVTAGVPDLLFRGVKVEGFWLVTWLKRQPAGTLGKIIAEVFELFRTGVYLPNVGKKYPLRDVHQALAEHSTVARSGKQFLVTATAE